MEKNNLKWNPSTRKYELPFDPLILNDFEFVDSAFLGKDKECVFKTTRQTPDPEKALELLRFHRLNKEFSSDISRDIISLARLATSNIAAVT